MGKIQKMVWPRGKNLKPLPKGRAPLQPIPGPRPRKTSAEKRQDQEYRLAISKGHYPRGQSPMQALMADPFLRNWLAAMARPDQADSRPTCTLADPASTGRAMPELREVLQLLAETPAPSRQPIEVTEAQYQALQLLPEAKSLQELADLTCIFGTAIILVKPDPEPLEGEVLPPETPRSAETFDHRADATAYMMQAMQARAAAKLTRIQRDMAMFAIWGWKLP